MNLWSRLRSIFIPGRLQEALRGALWFTPMMFVAGAMALAFVTLDIDRSGDTSFAFSGSADSARSLLSTLASAMLTFTGLVFSITIVALQLASSQWSPRVMRTFLRDRSSKVALGTFVGTMTYAFLVLRGIRSDFIPGISLTVAILSLLASVGVFIHYIDHIAHGLRVASMIAAVGDEGRAAVEELMPEDERPGPRAPQTVARPTVLPNDGDPGVLVAFDEDGLTACAAKAGVVLEVAVRVGEFVPGGAPLIMVHGGGGEALGRDPRTMVQLSRERTSQQDAGFALRQLVDIANRGLSPGVNDPTTAVQAIDRVHDLLALIGSRHIPDGWHADEEGDTVLVLPAAGWEDYVALGLDEVLLYGADHPQVRHRIAALIDDLVTRLPAERHGPLVRRRDGLST